MTAGRLDVTDIQCEHCGWIGDEGLYRPIPLQGTADLECPACQQAIEGLEVDWKERADAFEAELVEVRERAKAAEAEVACWRRAVRWYTIGDWRAELRVNGIGAYSHELGAVSQYPGGWTVEVHGVYKPGIQPDRNAACAKVCKFLAIPVVLPGGGE